MTPDGTSPPAVLFDIDGTLVDSNYLHVHAWYRAFSDAGVPVEAWRIHRSIGMDGAALLESLTPDTDDDTRQRAKELQSGYYKEMAPLLRQLPGARQLLEHVDSLGLTVVLATSAPDDELAILRKVLASDEIVSTTTSSKDVDTAKPQPDIVEIALARAGVNADQAVFVGDAVWDVEACERAGVACIGLLSGGSSRGELESAGAEAVYENAHDLWQHIAATRIAKLAQT